MADVDTRETIEDAAENPPTEQPSSDAPVTTTEAAAEASALTPVTEERPADSLAAMAEELTELRKSIEAAAPGGPARPVGPAGPVPAAGPSLPPQPEDTWLTRQASLATLGVLLVILSPVSVYLAYHLTPGSDFARQALIGWAFGSLVPIIGVAIWGLGSDRRDPLAFLVDGDRNRYSLSKLQIGVWTALIGGAIVAAVVVNLDAGAAAADASSLAIPEEVWALLGISVVGFVGSSLVKSQKRAAPALPTGTRAAPAAADAGGRVFKTLGAQAIADAPHVADLVQAEGSSGPTSIDMGKVQMLIFTVVVMFAYVMVLADAFQSGVAALGTVLVDGGDPETVVLAKFPAIDRSLATIIAISHAGYLVNKSVSTTPAVEPEP